METYNQHALSTIHAARRRDSLKDTALGMVSTLSFPAIVGTADMMLSLIHI
jgi:carbon dioxide concentrating mechanism protein CcmO